MLKLAVHTDATVAPTVATPGLVPAVYVIDACPVASEVDVESATVPPPLDTIHTTLALPKGLPFSSVTRTTRGLAAGEPTTANCSVPLTTETPDATSGPGAPLHAATMNAAIASGARRRARMTAADRGREIDVKW